MIGLYTSVNLSINVTGGSNLVSCDFYLSAKKVPIFIRNCQSVSTKEIIKLALFLVAKTASIVSIELDS